tara:strand:- start:218 stop:1174 length:957 start_codon:yes stop_codon:yes gene_type:complete
MNNEEKTILVTGGSGFIGSVTCKLLVDSGYNVINIDRVKRQQEGVTQYPFDIDNHQLKGVIELTKPDAVIHLAADHSVPLSIQDPASTYANNVANSISLLNHSINAGVKHFIFSSSSSVYGDSETILNAESDIPNPKTPYGRSKLILENVLKDYADAYEFNFASLRYFNAAGSYEGLGYTLNPKQHLVPILVDAILNDEVFTINGDDYETPDGTCIRDYTHVFDVASAHVSALNYLMDGGDSNIFNIGGGSGSSIKQVIAEVEKQLGKEVNVEVGPKREGDAERTDANIVKAFEMLGWEPQNTLEEIVADEIAYQSKK